MKTVNETHTKPRLALAIATDPVAAFHEITRRGLLPDAFRIVGGTGLLAAVSAISRGVALGPAQLLVVGRDNPLVWIGLWMLYALGVWGLLRWTGTRTDYRTVLTVLGWAHVYLLAHQAFGLVWGVLLAAEVDNRFVGQFFAALGVVLPVLYVMAVGRGLQAAGGVSFARGLIVYLAVWATTWLALDTTCGRWLLEPFREALPGVALAALRVAPELSPPFHIGELFKDPWMRGIEQFARIAAAVVGLGAGFWALGWRRAMGIAVAGAAVFAAYVGAWNWSGYYSSILAVQRMYAAGRYEQAAGSLEKFLPRLTENRLLVWGLYNKALITANVGDLYYRAELPDSSITHYRKFLRLVDERKLPGGVWENRVAAYGRIGDAYYLAGKPRAAIEYYDKMIHAANEAELGKAAKPVIAQAYTGRGAAYDLQGDHKRAVEQFKKATKAWPDYCEPWVRMAVTYNRMGEYKQAIESANHAIRKLDSEAAIAWVALAQAFANTGDTKQAGAAIGMVTGLAPDLAGRIGDEPSAWKDAVEKLTPADLKPPLEEQPAKSPY